MCSSVIEGEMGGPLPGFSSGGLHWRPLRFPGFRFQQTRRPAASDDANSSVQPKKFRFSIKAASTASVLALLGDTAAQLRSQWIRPHALDPSPQQSRSVGAKVAEEFRHHDWLRALRMATYGFLIYGPASQIWYEFLDSVLWEKTVRNLSIKVALNQVVLGPFVVAVVFAWNSLWQGKVDKLPALYHDHAFPTLVDGWKFWIPASVLNFAVVPLQARVAFMSSCSIFWNFYLSTTMGKA